MGDRLKYSPAPWTMQFNGAAIFTRIYDANGRYIIAGYPRGFDESTCSVMPDEMKGNALLMRAAPVMYEALELVYKDVFMHEGGAAKEAVRKALDLARHGTGEEGQM
jgi:hypothetical protein